jgi:hypothetical protein
LVLASFVLNEICRNSWHDERRKERYLVWKIERKQPNYLMVAERAAHFILNPEDEI